MRNILSRLMRRKSTAHKKSYYGKQDAQHLPTTDQGDVLRALRAASDKRKETEGETGLTDYQKAFIEMLKNAEPHKFVTVIKGQSNGPSAYPIWESCDKCKASAMICALATTKEGVYLAHLDNDRNC